MSTMTTGRNIELFAPLAEEIEALAEHARLHGPAPDCAVKVEAVIAKHRARIEAARRAEREALREPSEAD